MGKVLDFRKKQQEREVTHLLVELSGRIDQILLSGLENGLDPKEVAGILSHRLGNLMSHIDNKEELWDICERVLKREAKID